MTQQITTLKVSDNLWYVENKSTGQLAHIVSFVDSGIFMRNPRIRYRVDVNGVTVASLIDHFQTAKKTAREVVSKPLASKENAKVEISVASLKTTEKHFYERLYKAFKQSKPTEKLTYAIIQNPYFIAFRVNGKEGRTVIEVYYSIKDEHQKAGLQYTFEESTGSNTFNSYVLPYGDSEKLKRILDLIDLDTLVQMFNSKNPVITNQSVKM